MLSLSVVKDMKWQTYRKQLIMVSFLPMKNSAYYCPYGTGTEHNYLISCVMGDNDRGICFVEDEKTMRLHGVAGKPTHIDILNFPTSYYNPCEKDRWNVVCVVYDTTLSKSSLWVNHGNVCDFACRLPMKPSTLNLFNRVVHFDKASGFNGYIGSVEMFNYYKTILSGFITPRMTYLCEKYKILEHVWYKG